MVIKGAHKMFKPSVYNLFYPKLKHFTTFFNTITIVYYNLYNFQLIYFVYYIQYIKYGEAHKNVRNPHFTIFFYPKLKHFTAFFNTTVLSFTNLALEYLQIIVVFVSIVAFRVNFTLIHC